MSIDNEYGLTTLFWEATLRCNARCEFCGSGCGDVSCFPDELTGDEIRSALLDISRKLTALCSAMRISQK